jgi:SagB-type dehydrogenase family enzyme
VSAYGYHRLPLRTFPSSGGLQSPEVYLFIQAAGGIPCGLYYYNPLERVLETLASGDQSRTLLALVPGQPYIQHSAVVVAITGHYERLRWKYGPRAYRYMCIDAGFLAENLYLTGQALGLGICAIAGFVDDVLEHVLNIDGRGEVPLLLATVGVTADSLSG